MKKLNVGCGKDVREGYVNLDVKKSPGIDVVHNLDKYPWPFKNNEFEEVYCNNILEHLNDIIKPIEEIWRISKNKAIVKVIVPIFPSVGAFADPTHKQYFTYMTFDYFRPEDGLNYYSKARFKIKKKKIIFSKYLKFMEPIVNLNTSFQKIYYNFFAFTIPAYFLYFELEVIKNEK